MEIKSMIYMILAIAQILILSRIRMEGEECGWNRQAKWIGFQSHLVMVPLITLTATANWIFCSSDELMDWMMVVAFAALTLLVVLHLPDILSAMTDKEVGEDLNIHTNDSNNETSES